MKTPFTTLIQKEDGIFNKNQRHHLQTLFKKIESLPKSTQHILLYKVIKTEFLTKIKIPFTTKGHQDSIFLRKIKLPFESEEPENVASSNGVSVLCSIPPAISFFFFSVYVFLVQYIKNIFMINNNESCCCFSIGSGL